MVNRSKKMSDSSESEDQSRWNSDSDDSTFVPEVRNASGRGRRGLPQGRRESVSHSEETTAVTGQRGRKSRRGRRKSLDLSNVSRRRSGRLQRVRVDLEETEDSSDSPRAHALQDDTASEESHEARAVAERSGPRGIKRTRTTAKVVEAVWTPKRTVRITFDVGMKHGCMNPIHGKTNVPYKVLHLVRCPWKKNVGIMTNVLETERPKTFQFCHKLCEPCLEMYGNRCFKCLPVEGGVTPILHTLFGSDAITCVDDFRVAVDKWTKLQHKAQAGYLVVHCTLVGPEARLLRRRFSLKHSTRIHIVYSDVRDRMNLAGSGINLEDSEFRDVWRTIMKEKVPSQDADSMVSFFGNILLNNGMSFNDFRVDDLLVLYERHILDGVEEEAIPVCINSLCLHSLPYFQADPSECCLRDAVVHNQREPASRHDDCLFQQGNVVADLFYKAVKRCFGHKIVAEFEQRAELGEALRIGDDGQKLPFRKLFAAVGGEMQFRRVNRATQDVARRDARSRVCGWDTSSFELACWTQRGHPVGGDFVIPGLMYRFGIGSGSCIIFRPARYFHATLPMLNRDLKNERFAAAFVTPT